MKFIANLFRILLGLVFIGSGFVKGIDPLGSEYKFIEYFNAFGLGGLNASALFFSFLLSGLEFLIGICPVSYTHLDVYKRQGDIRIGITRHTGEAEIIRAGILLHNDPAIYGPITEAVPLVYGRTIGRERVPGQMWQDVPILP